MTTLKKGSKAGIIPEAKTERETAPAVAAVADITASDVSKDDYKIEVIRDFDGSLDPFYLSKKDPEYEYRFLKDDQKNLTIKTSNLLFQKGGWEICQRTHLARIGISERFISADGLYRVGDTILARIPKKLHEEKMVQKKKDADAQIEMIQRRVKDGDQEFGRGIHSTVGGLKTEKELGMK